MKSFLIYGANGYTGRLISQEAKRQGLQPVLAGRDVQAIKHMAKELDLRSRVFSLDSITAIEKNLKDIHLVLHCAGPFSQTAAPMIEACLQSKTHYLDITGEVAILELIHSFHQRAKDSQIVICSGVGFDVVPTDCLAAKLKEALPDATHLSLGFDSNSGMSPGTLKTAIEGISTGGGLARINAKIEKVPLAWKTREIDFGNGLKKSVTIPWGDIASAFYSTKIPNIEVYLASSDSDIKKLQKLKFFSWLLSKQFLQNFLKKRVSKKAGPTFEQRKQSPSYIWGEASNQTTGAIRTARLQTTNGYTLTADASLAIVRSLLDKNTPPGSYTPSQLMGVKFIESLPQSGKIFIEENSSPKKH